MPTMQDYPGSISGLGRSPGEGNDNPFQYSCLGNPMDRGAWWAPVYGVSRVRHDSVTKPPPRKLYRLHSQLHNPNPPQIDMQPINYYNDLESQEAVTIFLRISFGRQNGEVSFISSPQLSKSLMI